MASQEEQLFEGEEEEEGHEGEGEEEEGEYLGEEMLEEEADEMVGEEMVGEGEMDDFELNNQIYEQEPFDEQQQQPLHNLRGRKKKKFEQYDLEQPLPNFPQVKRQEPKVKKEPREEDWQTTSQTPSTKPLKTKIQADQKSVIFRRARRRKVPLIVDGQDNETVKRAMMQMAKQYNKRLFDEIREREKVKMQSGVKEEEDWVSIDRQLFRFPLDNQKMKQKKFASVQEFKQAMAAQQQELLQQINDPTLHPIFYSSFTETVKKTNGSKQYHNFQCKLQNCPAMLKCVVDPEGCDIYLFRNFHNHTISGEFLPEREVKPAEVLVIDEELHQMFGINKGVRSQTRNIAYQDPQQRKVHQAEMRSKYKDRKKDGEAEDSGVSQRNPRKPPKRRSKARLKGGKIDETVEFVNMVEELIDQKYRVQYLADAAGAKFPQTVVLANSKMSELLALGSPEVRMSIHQQAIKLEKKKNPEQNVWNLVLFTTLNKALKPLTVALALTCSAVQTNVVRIFELFLKISPYRPSHLICDCRPQIYEPLQNLLQSEQPPIRCLVDSSSFITSKQKELKHKRKLRYLQELLDPANYFRQEECLTHLRKEKTIISSINSIKHLFIVDQSLTSFKGFAVNLDPERQLINTIKTALRTGLNRQTFRRQFGELIKALTSCNTVSQAAVSTIDNLHIEKAHKDQHLLAVRQQLCPKVLNQFYLQYCQAAVMEADKQGSTFKFEAGQVTVKEGLCSCRYAQVTGLPCRHLLHGLIESKREYIWHISERWKVGEDRTGREEVKCKKEKSKGKKKTMKESAGSQQQ